LGALHLEKLKRYSKVTAAMLRITLSASCAIVSAVTKHKKISSFKFISKKMNKDKSIILVLASVVVVEKRFGMVRLETA
jgi:hypothetical protein